MKDPEQFDAFYKDARERLLVQTYALTGDLAASRRAVRDAFVVAWHHWRKTSRLDDPETVVRPHAWKLAQRHHTARIWHRDNDISPEVKEILDALGKLSPAQRKALVLTQLATVTMPQMAREVGLPLEAAERELQAGATQLSMAIDTPTPALRATFETVAASISDTSPWPRATIIRRAGAARRRTHTTVGALGAVAAVVLTGAVVTTTSGARPTLHRVDVTGPPATASSAPSTTPTPAPVVLPTSQLLTAASFASAYDRRDWTVVSTDDNEGDGGDSGLVVPCQTARYADPQGVAALVRVFTSSAGAKVEKTTATQIVEASGGLRRAERTFSAMTQWFGGCTAERVQLLGTSAPDGVGDEAVQLVLRSWKRPVTTYVVSLARTGLYSTAIFVTLSGDAKPDRAAAARVLADSVNGLCTLPDGGACATSEPVLSAQPPLPTGDDPALLSAIDLPPLTGVRHPWVGATARKAKTNDAASACDRTTFVGPYRGATFTHNATRTFVIPEAEVSQEFGLTETVGSLPVPQAKALVEKVRARLASCSVRDLNTEVEQVARRDVGATSLTAWRLEISVTDKRSVTFWMAIVRDGTSLAQVGFLPDRGAEMPPGAFVALAQRSLERLAELPPPRKGG